MKSKDSSYVDSFFSTYRKKSTAKQNFMETPEEEAKEEKSSEPKSVFTRSPTTSNPERYDPYIQFGTTKARVHNERVEDSSHMFSYMNAQLENSFFQKDVTKPNITGAEIPKEQISEFDPDKTKVFLQQAYRQKSLSLNSQAESKTVIKDIADPFHKGAVIPERDSENIASEMSRIELFNNSHNIEAGSLYQIHKLLDQKEPFSKSDICKLVASGIVGGVGSGLAMMPIYNHELKNLSELGIDLTGTAGSTLSTLNTFAVYSPMKTVNIYKMLNDVKNSSELSCVQKTALMSLGSVSAIYPTLLLWTVEMHNQKVEGSSGFDKFIAWSTMTTAPLIVGVVADTYNNAKELVKNPIKVFKPIEDQNMAVNTLIYSLSAASLIANSVALKGLSYDVFSEIGSDDSNAETASIILGISSALLTTPQSHIALKSVFEKNTNNHKNGCTKALKGIVSGVEGMWFSLPKISAGLKAVSDWSPLVKGGLFTSLFASSTALDANNILSTFSITQPEADNLNQDLLGDNQEVLQDDFS